MSGDRLACQHVIDRLRKRDGQTMDPATEQAVNEHLKTCPSCAHWESTMRAAIAVFGTAANRDVPESVRRRLEKSR